MVRPRSKEYALGRFVSWEWDMERTFEEAWYEDSTKSLPKLAFSSSATFAGREYPEQWGIQWRLRSPEAGLR